ncbi:MAG: hypothetical protein ISR65_13655 [Bacteriovoracaceae bacterium]|nr:hypothetical protein [Bacteriovoracaceae bacterium]
MNKVDKYILVLLFVLFSCSEKEFRANRSKNVSTVDPLWQSQSTLCSDFTSVKPKVDFLFLWDNSWSYSYLNDETKRALNYTIDTISNRFDYHIMMAPINVRDSDPVNKDAFLVVESPTGLNSSAMQMVVAQSIAATRLGSFPTTGGSLEKGFDRAYSLITSNRSNGIFRNEVYTIVVLMSNGDDAPKTEVGRKPSITSYLNAKKTRFIELRDNILNAIQFRFMSIVAHQTGCQQYAVEGKTYKMMSSAIYTAPYPSGYVLTDQSSNPTPDSYNICSTSFSHIFDGVNNSIQGSIERHVYNFWPIAQTTGPAIDTSNIIVKKVLGQTTTDIARSATNGFTVLSGVQTNQNTRLRPTPGEPFTGYMIELHGEDNYVTYPECLFVQTSAPLEYYGYVQLHSRPIVSSIQLKINGRTIAKSTTNGWDFSDTSFKSAQNIKVISPTNLGPATPAVYKTGYFLKLYGSSVYSNGSTVEATYDPSVE